MIVSVYQGVYFAVINPIRKSLVEIPERCKTAVCFPNADIPENQQ
jgi:hypothetical protein